MENPFATARIQVPRILCVVGPTASGKSGLALDLARMFDGEIVNADSRQVYRGMEIGTGISKKDGGIPHHLYAFLEPHLSITVSEWRNMALEKIHQIVERGKVPIIVGGTGLYIRSLVDNPQYPQVPPQPALRQMMQHRPLKDLVADLLVCDPDAAACVDLKNPRRVMRALEVFLVTSTPFTAQKAMGPPLVHAVQVGLRHTADMLRTRIEANIDEMVRAGWVEETKRLLDAQIPKDAIAMTSLGYPEMIQYLEQGLPLEHTVNLIKAGVWGYARRQMTWFRKDPRIHWVEDETGAASFWEEATKNAADLRVPAA